MATTKTTKITPAQQAIIDKIHAGFRLTMYYTPRENFYHSAGFDGNYRGASVKTVLAMQTKGLIEEVSRKESDYSSTTYVIEYQLIEEQ